MNSQHEPETIKIVVEEVRDGFRIFHTNFELTTLEGQQVSRHEVSTDGEFAPIATEVVQLPGVETVILRPYGSGIHKAMAFDRRTSARREGGSVVGRQDLRGGPEAEAKQSEEGKWSKTEVGTRKGQWPHRCWQIFTYTTSSICGSNTGVSDGRRDCRPLRG